MDQLFQPFNSNRQVCIRYRNLPHWEQPGCTYFVTFRCADSLPRKQREILRLKREFWKTWKGGNLTREEKLEYFKIHSEQVDRWLDAGAGLCLLSRPEVASIVAESLRFFDGRRYVLDRFVIMPNHVHTLFKPLAGFRIRTILHTWKSFTANRIKQLAAYRQGIWQEETFDHIVRSAADLEYYRRYIEKNPTREGLRSGFLLGKGIGLTVLSA